ncbi:PdaC/SigV domain-containing protein [Paenibacillus sp. IHBB 10380]|uniref:PdaC/SigV domain-containing protein n=1 Tax=Paenibacillus sp. IHBB 10380 TaxID=1566358 RepID=UPI0005CFA504|nr:DUF4163 domain-containing protein [Paenibacillus sp. IHBB 10380]AJS60835.1 hypothetical protein UB51_22960 [Paenibacillus sp. IHBB 10380]
MNKVMKWSAAAMAAGILIASSGFTGEASVLAAGNIKNTVQQTPVALKWKGTKLSQKGLMSEGNTLIPLTVLRDQLGLPLSYNPGTRTYSIGSGYTQLNMEVSQHGVNTNINNYYLYEYEVKNINGRIYVPFKLMNDYLGYQGAWDPSTKTLNISKRILNPITIKTETLEKATSDAVYLLHYPKVSGLVNSDAENVINNVLEQHMKKFNEESIKEANNRDDSIEHAYQYIQNYMVTYNRNGVLSLVVDQYGNTGGAHGGTIRTGFTFSLKDGKLLTANDLLKKSNPTYRTMLNKDLAKKLKAHEGYLGGFKALRANPDFNVSENGMLFFFQQYEYTDYAVGIPTFAYPFDQLLPKGTDPFKSYK